MTDAPFCNKYGPWALIAGASEGIGENNRATASQVWTVDRRTLAEMISAACTDFVVKRAR
ncbi:hypothetical protein ABQE44_23005 [Mycolicibacterium sp. XJ2546]